MAYTITKEIEILRHMLHEEIRLANDLTKREIIEASIKLDDMLNEYYKMLLSEEKAI